MTSERARSYLPSASLEVLQQRARLLQVVRGVFAENGYWEVETPLLAYGVIPDAHVEPFKTPFSPDGGSPQHDAQGVLYLQTSPESAMKRLLAAGATAIYQITRAFRNGEVGRYHNPEFTMLEWYRTGDTYHDQMSFVESLIRETLPATVLEAGKHRGDSKVPPRAKTQSSSVPFERFTYDRAFERYTGRRVLGLCGPDLASLARQYGVQAPIALSDDDCDGWLNLLLTELVEPRLGELGPVFLYDYPASQAALATIRRDDPPVAERFELYVRGIEVCNGYQELTDADELVKRFCRQLEIRQMHGRQTLSKDTRLVAALEHGLPSCAGVALGLDRLVMLAIGASSISEVMSFGFDRV